MKKLTLLLALFAIANIYCYSQVTEGFVPRFVDKGGKTENSIIFQNTDKTYGIERLGFGANNLLGVYHFTSYNSVYPTVVIESIAKEKDIPASSLLFQLNEELFQSKISYKSLYEGPMMKPMLEKGENIGFLSFEIMNPQSKKLTEAMRLTDIGYLGIGIDKPNTKLHVYAETPTTATFENNYGQFIMAFEKEKSALRSIGTNDNGGIAFETYYKKAGALNENQLYLSETGNVAIGHNAPSSKLDILSNNASVAKFTNSQDGTALEMTVAKGESSLIANNSINFKTMDKNGGSIATLGLRDSMIYLESELLHIQVNRHFEHGPLDQWGHVMTSFACNTYSKVEIYHHEVHAGIRNRTKSRGFEIATTNSNGNLNSNQLYLNASGNVGIRTSTPSTSFEISNGTLKLSGSSLRDNESARFVIDLGSATGERFIELRNTGGRQFAVNGDGKVYAKEVNVMVNIPADYVFEPSYELMDIQELEKYVTINKHLPNVPSAKEITTNGYNIGEMSNILLEKIEELTLYTIQQQKLIEEQSGKIKELSETTSEQQKMINELKNKFKSE